MFIYLDHSDPRPLYQQIVAQVKDQVQGGVMQPGEELPSVRDLAKSLGINLHTVRSAYLKLREQGVVDMRLGRRARIARRRPSPASPSEAERALGGRMKELVADSYLLGLSTDDLHALIDRYSQPRNNRGSSEGSSMEERRQ